MFADLVRLVREPGAPAADRRPHDGVHHLEQLLHALVHSQIFPSLDLLAQHITTPHRSKGTQTA